MKLTIRGLVPMAALLLVSSAQADDLADFKKWYTAGLPQMKKAMEGKDLAFFEKCSTADFTYTSGGRTSKKKEAMVGLKQMFDQTKSLKYTFKITGFKKTKSGMVVTLTNHYEMTMMPGPDKKTHVMVMDQPSRETWKKSGKTWLLTNITDVGTGKATMDGKPFDMSKMGG